MSDPFCRNYRELLGVYVVGAIEPAERAVVESHLGGCSQCREELAGLAVLPALLHRVSPADAERLADTAIAGEDNEPPDAILDGLLSQVSARRRARRLRGVFAVAAAVAIAAGSGVVISHGLAPHHQPTQAVDVASANTKGVGITVKYGESPLGWTTMMVQVNGIKPWTACKFWVLTKTGHKELAGGWIVGASGYRLWYPAEAEVPEANVTAFVLSFQAHGRDVQVRIPAV